MIQKCSKLISVRLDKMDSGLWVSPSASSQVLLQVLIHAVMADVGCRNTVFGAEAQTDPQSLKSWIGAGISNFRVEFVHQTPEQVAAITEAFGDFLSGDCSVEQLGTALETASPQSITQGSLFAPGGFKKTGSAQLATM